MQRTQTILCSLLLLGATSGCGLEQFIDENVRFFDIEPRMYEVDPEDGTATTLPAYSSLRSLGTTAMVAGELVSLVGIDEKSKFNSDVQVFDPASNSWRAGAPWPQPRAAAGLVDPGGRVRQSKVVGTRSDMSSRPQASISSGISNSGDSCCFS